MLFRLKSQQTIGLIFLAAISLSACNGVVKTTVLKSKPPMPFGTEVGLVYEEDDAVEGSELIGTTRVKDTGFSVNCGYTYGVSAMKEEARRLGGNLVVITEHKKPSAMGSSCHQFRADIRLAEALNDDEATEEQEPEEMDNAPIVESNDDADNDYYSSPTDELYVGQSSSYPSARINIQYGISRRIAKLATTGDSGLDSYLKELKNGTHIKFDIHGFFNERSGLGFTYSQFSSENSLFPVQFEDMMGNTVIGEIRDDIDIRFYGPTFMSRSLLNSIHSSVYYGLGLGVMTYDNDARVLTDVNISGSTLGTSMMLGFDVALSESAAIGGEVSYMGGVIRKIEVEENGNSQTITLQEEQYEGLAHINFGIGLRLKL